MFAGLKQYKIYKKLAWLNELPASEAEYVLRECGGSDEWARGLSSVRPFVMLEDLFDNAREHWALTAEGGEAGYSRICARLGKLLER